MRVLSHYVKISGNLQLKLLLFNKLAQVRTKLGKGLGNVWVGHFIVKDLYKKDKIFRYLT